MSEREKLLEAMKADRLLPIRNMTAIQTWINLQRPELSPLVNKFFTDAGKGDNNAQLVVFLLMMVFAAGRAYQEANPTAPSDPDGYR